MQRRRRRRQRLPCAVRVREYFRQFVAFMFSNVGVIGLVVGYTIAGSFIFTAIEGSSEIERVLSMARHRQLTAERLWLLATVPLNVFDERLWKYNVSAELQNYQDVIVRAVRKGWDGSDDTEYYRQWSFPGAFLYSLTIITTIGYGNIAPRTDWGKVATIFYAMIGMPLFLLYLTNLGDVLARSFKWFYVNVCLCRGCPGIAKRRATRLRMQIQAQLGEPLDPLTATRPDTERRRSAPEWRSRQRYSALEMLQCSGPLDDRFPSSVQRGVSEPCFPDRYDLELRQLREGIDSVGSRRRRRGVEQFDEIYRGDVRGIDALYRQERREEDQIDNIYREDRRRTDQLGKRYNRDRDTYDRCDQNVDERYRQRREIDRYHDIHTNIRRNKVDDGYYEACRGINRLSERGNSVERADSRYRQQKRGPNQRVTDQRDRRRNCEDPSTKRIDQVDRRYRENRQFMRNNESQYDYWYRNKNLVPPQALHSDMFLEGDDFRREGIHNDPMDNYGEFQGYEMEETADSDEFTYITIDSQNVAVPITICVFIMVGYIMFGAMLFGMWEDWDRVDGSYFCFISLTSIGFGDIVPGERIYARATRNDHTKRIDTSFILCSMYLLFGMALIAMCFNLMQEQVVQYLAGAKRVFRRICRCKCR